MTPWFKKKLSPPDAVAVLNRIVILKHLFVKALATPPPEQLAAIMERWTDSEREKFLVDVRHRHTEQSRFLRAAGLWDMMDESERNLIEAGPTEVSMQSLIDANWGSEAAVSLLWALGYVAELPSYDQQCDPELMNKLPQKSMETLRREVTLLPTTAIHRQRDVAELWHWRSRTRQLLESGQMAEKSQEISGIVRLCSVKAAQDGMLPSPIDDDFPAMGKAYRDLDPEEYSMVTSISIERHRAFNWLCGYAPDNEWSKTPTNT